MGRRELFVDQLQRGLVVGLLVLGGVHPAVQAATAKEKNEVTERLAAAATVFREVMSAPDKGIPQNLLDDAACVVIVPGLKKGAFIVGGRYGKGFIDCRKPGGVGWTGPAAVTVEGGSFGFQIGGQESDVVMLLMNKRAEDRLLSSQFTVGADASVAAGPVGRSTSANTDAYMTAELLSWSRTRGVFAGLALQGATLREDRDTNRLLYGKALTNKQIIEGNATAPPVAHRLVSMLDKYSSRKAS